MKHRQHRLNCEACRVDCNGSSSRVRAAPGSRPLAVHLHQFFLMRAYGLLHLAPLLPD